MSIIRHFPQGIPKAIGPYTPATQINLDNLHDKKNQDQVQNNLVYVSGQIPINPQTNQIQSQNIQDQAHQVMKNLSKALQGSNCNFGNVLKTTILLTDMQNFSKVNEIYGSYFKKDQYPARVCYAVKTLPKDSLIQIDAIAVKQTIQQGQQPSKRVKLTKQQKQQN